MRINYILLGVSFVGMFLRLVLSQIMLEEVTWKSKLKNFFLLPFGIVFAVGMIVNTFRGVVAGLLIFPPFLRGIGYRLEQLRTKKLQWNFIGRIFRSKLETFLFMCFTCLLYFGNSLASIHKTTELSWSFFPSDSIFTFYSTESLFLYLYYSHCFISSCGLLFVTYWSLDSHIPSSSTSTLIERASFLNQVNFARGLFSFVGMAFCLIFYDAISKVGQ